MKITSHDIQEAGNRIKPLIKDAYTILNKTPNSLSNIIENKKFAKKYDLQYLGSGAYRVAFKYKDIVVKVTRHEDSTYNVLSEVETWNSIRKDKRTYIKALFNPILHHGLIKVKYCGDTVEHAYSISPYVTPLLGNTKTVNSTYKTIRKFADLLFCDCHSGNYGIIDGLPVIIDYQEDEIDMHQTKDASNHIKNLLQEHYKKIKKLSKVAA